MSDALNWLAIVLNAQGQEDEELAVLERAVRVDPMHPSIVYNWAEILIRRGEEARAEQFLLRVIEGPLRNSCMPYLLLQNMYMSTGRLVDLCRIIKREAKGALERELKARELRIWDMQPSLIYYLGKLQSLAGDFTSALTNHAD